MTYFLSLIKKIETNALALVLCFVCLFSTSLNAQTWERFYNFYEFDYLKSVIPTADGGILYLGQSLTNIPPAVETAVIMVKTDRDGHLIWQRSFTLGFYEEIFQAIPTSDGNLLIGGLTFDTSGNGSADGWILKMDLEGSVLWERKYGGSGWEKILSLQETPDGGFIFAGETRSGISGDIIEAPLNTDSLNAKDSWLGKIDADGDLLWNHRFGSYEDDFLVSLTITADGDIVSAGNYHTEGIDGSWDISIYRHDEDGNLLWNEIYGEDGYENAFSIIQTSDGNFAIGGMTSSQGNGGSDTYLLQIDSDGEIIDEDVYGGTEGEFAGYVQEMPDGGFSILSCTESFGSDLLDLYLIRTEPNGDERWSKVYDGGDDRFDVPFSFFIDDNGYYYIVAQQQEKPDRTTITSAQSYFLKVDALGNTTTNLLTGKVAIDNNNNCIVENGEKGLEDWLVIARGIDESFYSTTDVDGNYVIELEVGDYSIDVIPPGEYWEPCEESPFISIDSAYDTTEYNLSFNDKAIVCADMEIDLSTPFLEYCDKNVYHVRYRNNGTVVSAGAMVDIILPTSFNFISSTATLGGQNDSLYTFFIDDVLVNSTGGFQIIVEHDCSNENTGLTHELLARIIPDEICLPDDPIWDEASIELKAEIVGNNVQFVIENVGTGDMGIALTGVIIEDWLIPRTEPIQLNSLESDTITVTPEGKTVRLEIPQTPGHPGRSNPSITVEGVGTNTTGGITTGYVNHYPEDDANRFKSIDAQISYQNFLPNALRAYPRGYGNNRVIAPNGDIEYHLRFQHTGNDTLPWLYIENELPAELNVETLRPGASSHSYDYEVVGDGVVRFNFLDINLVGDEIDEAASYGFIKFKVSQQSDLPDGTNFFNQVTIQTPNSRSKTNGVWHSIERGNRYGAYVATHCTGDILFGQVLTEDIVLRDTLTRGAQDSITTAKIYVLKDTITDVLVELNPGEFYNEALYLEDTTLVKFYVAANGCDSIVNTHLDILTNTTSLEHLFHFSLYPNPGYEQVAISYRLPASSKISIRLYQATGRMYQEINRGNQSAGMHQLTLPANLPSGIYWVELRSSQGATTKKLVIQ